MLRVQMCVCTLAVWLVHRLESFSVNRVVGRVNQIKNNQDILQTRKHDSCYLSDNTAHAHAKRFYSNPAHRRMIYDSLQYTRMIDQYREVRASNLCVLTKHSQCSIRMTDICSVSRTSELTYETELLVAFYFRSSKGTEQMSRRSYG